MSINTAKLRHELAQRRASLAFNERMAKDAEPRKRFAYAAAATKQRSKIARLERTLSDLTSRQPRDHEFGCPRSEVWDGEGGCSCA